jgi:hypothetical protein
MNSQRGRTLQETRTPVAPGDVLAQAKAFFGARSAVYAAFVEREGPNHLVLRGQGGEEIVIAVRPDGDATSVSGASYLYDQQVARFLASLPRAAESAA